MGELAARRSEGAAAEEVIKVKLIVIDFHMLPTCVVCVENFVSFNEVSESDECSSLPCFKPTFSWL
jgi:hypothetical protein